jgi:pimeloyl-ACP methyl ester carboxylesterase
MKQYSLWIRGVRVFVEVRGGGEPVVLVHGLGGPAMWQKIVPKLEARFEVIVIHLPGFGYSEKTSRLSTVALLSEVVSDILERLSIKHATLVGISVGGQIASYVARARQDVDDLVVIAGTGMTDVVALRSSILWSVVRYMMERVILRSKKLVCRLSAKSFFDPSSRPSDLCERAFRTLRHPGARSALIGLMRDVMRRDTNLAEIVPQLNARLMIVWGEQDRVIPPAAVHTWRRFAPEAPIVLLPSCGHSVPLEKPEMLAEVVEKFINGD